MSPASAPGRASSSRLILAVFIAVFAATFALLWYRQHPAQPQPGKGTPWTVLQDIEEQHRTDRSAEAPLLVSHPEKSGYLVLGLPTGEVASPWVWILLNEHGADHTPDAQPKLMPANGRFHVDCAYVDKLIAGNAVDPSAQGLLKRKCSR
jgi:hypothetical protein